MDILQLIITATINYAAIMLVVALGGMFSERSGVINIALDGTMIVGALAGSLFLASVSKPGTVPDNPMMLQLVTILISAFAGGIYSLLLAFASVNLKADQTIGGTAQN
ncbi:MAG: ABC transporter permease, partial [Clostridia bacterium]